MSAVLEILLHKIIDIVLSWLVRRITAKKLARAGLRIYRMAYGRLFYKGEQFKRLRAVGRGLGGLLLCPYAAIFAPRINLRHAQVKIYAN